MQEEIKSLTLRMPKEIWSLLKKNALYKEISLTELINDCLVEYLIKRNNKLTRRDTKV